MTANKGDVTLGNVTTWPLNNGYPAAAYPYAGGVYTQGTYCGGDTHVWACAHAEKCKCGYATRVVTKRICPGCGQEHA